MGRIECQGRVYGVMTLGQKLEWDKRMGHGHSSLSIPQTPRERILLDQLRFLRNPVRSLGMR